jgi:hypothetical protein
MQCKRRALSPTEWAPHTGSGDGLATTGVWQNASPAAQIASRPPGAGILRKAMLEVRVGNHGEDAKEYLAAGRRVDLHP